MPFVYCDTLCIKCWCVIGRYRGSYAIAEWWADQRKVKHWGIRGIPSPFAAFRKRLMCCMERLVGDGISDHYCWQRPEDMTTPRQAYKIYANHFGSDLAGETSAAMDVASIVFRHLNLAYSNELLNHARQLFTFSNIEENMIATPLLHNSTMVLGVDTVMNFSGQRHGFMRPPTLPELPDWQCIVC